MDDDVEDGNDLAFQWYEAPSIAAQLSIVNSRATLCIIDGIAQDSKTSSHRKASPRWEAIRSNSISSSCLINPVAYG